MLNSKLLTIPMHWPTHGQWWSNLWTQLSQIEQWEARGGRNSKQVSQYFTFTAWPFTIISFVRGSFIWGVLPLTHSIDGVVTSKASSDSGGLEFLGTIPGSLAEATKRKIKSCMKMCRMSQQTTICNRTSLTENQSHQYPRCKCEEFFQSKILNHKITLPQTAAHEIPEMQSQHTFSSSLRFWGRKHLHVIVKQDTFSLKPFSFRVSVVQSKPQKIREKLYTVMHQEVTC